MAKKKIRDLRPLSFYDDGGADSQYEEYKALLMNAVRITGLESYVENFVKSCMIENNCVGYDKITQRWAIAYGAGLNEYWLPTVINFYFPNTEDQTSPRRVYYDGSLSYQRPAFYEPAENGAYLIKGLPADISFREIMLRTLKIISECDISIRQNLIAARTPYAAIVKDDNTKLSLLQAVQQKEDGAPAVVVNADIADGLKSVRFDVDYIVDKVATFRDMERDRLLNKLGIMSANINKRERVQVGEVNATVGQCVDYIYLWIDTFNNQMMSYGLPYRMEINGSLEELYTQESEVIGV